ncbi:MAG: hypothetical protein JWL97_3600, partial [Gemmatimonadales bacterium]|nr:hypothetical protein [Gemmatimonadales bacterium]
HVMVVPNPKVDEGFRPTRFLYGEWSSCDHDHGRCGSPLFLKSQ